MNLWVIYIDIINKLTVDKEIGIWYNYLNSEKEAESMENGKLNILNKFFTRNTFRHLIEEGSDIAYTSVIKRYIDTPDNKMNAELVSEIYSVLRKDYRNEYFYKNTLLNKLLLGVHSINTTTALTEIPIERSKADFVLINGKAVVYEIKTELDNLERLESQIIDYYKAFDHVSVVTCKDNLPELEKKITMMEKPVGVYVLQKQGSLSPIRIPGKYSDLIDGGTLFKILRKAEYEDIILSKYESLPKVTQFKYYSECKKLFLKIPIDEVYELFLKQLKKRSHIVKEELEDIPYEIKFLAYFMELRDFEYERLSAFLTSVYGGV